LFRQHIAWNVRREICANPSRRGAEPVGGELRRLGKGATRGPLRGLFCASLALGQLRGDDRRPGSNDSLKCDHMPVPRLRTAGTKKTGSEFRRESYPHLSPAAVKF